MNSMKETITKYRNKTKMLQGKINVLTKEFQKFINCAFNTLPEHADFLLPLNSINSTNKEDAKQEKSAKLKKCDIYCNKKLYIVMDKI